jgi:hypothetical protein
MIDGIISIGGGEWLATTAFASRRLAATPCEKSKR